MLTVLFSCEEVITIDLPSAQNLVVIEGWVTDSLSTHPVRITRSSAFSSMDDIVLIEDAQLIVQASTGEVFPYSYSNNGYYEADIAFRGAPGNQYRLLAIVDTVEIRSEWDSMPERVDILSLEIESFEENDPNNPNQQLTVYYPKINAIDPADRKNQYRWIFYKNDTQFTEPEPITIQNDRLFNGNLIPNNFQAFGYDSGEKITLQLQSISSSAHNYLSLLKSQITTLGTSSGTTPAIVEGNLSYTDDDRMVLGFFGSASSSIDSVFVE